MPTSSVVPEIGAAVESSLLTDTPVAAALVKAAVMAPVAVTPVKVASV